MRPALRELHPYWVLARPAGVWAAALLPLVGYGWAHWDRALIAWNQEWVPLLLLAWLSLNVGTLWLNAARDRDVSDVLFGRAVRIPRRLSLAGYGALALAVGLSLVLENPWIAGMTVSCAILSVLYSHPKTAWKGHPVLGPLTNILGYGMLSPGVGYALVGTPLTQRTVVITIIIALIVLSAYFAAQAFQAEEDRARGDRTLVVTHGPRATLIATRMCFGSAVLLGLALVLFGWLPLALLGALPGLWWIDRLLARWSRCPLGGDVSDAKRLARAVFAVTVLTLSLAAGDYIYHSVYTYPVAGLSTQAGHPPDRALLPHPILRSYDEVYRASHGRPYWPS
ncbi:MAG: hypothetical protein EA397_19165 [Deltaproteobacteria bacterium]|nr:MAG: hypothetical protein EA397_19165 [Deltaproteobacteria bacterium]